MLSEKWNRKCYACEFYPWELPHEDEYWPYRSEHAWVSRIFFGTKLIYENGGEEIAGPLPEQSSLTEDHTLVIFGKRYSAHYQWQKNKWVLFSKAGRVTFPGQLF